MAETVETSTSEEKIAYLWRIGWKPKALFGDVLVADAVVFFVRSVRDRLEGTAEIQAMKSLFWKKESYMVPHVCCYKIDLEAQLTQLLKSHFCFRHVERYYILFIWCMLFKSTLEMANYSIAFLSQWCSDILRAASWKADDSLAPFGCTPSQLGDLPTLPQRSVFGESDGTRYMYYVSLDTGIFFFSFNQPILFLTHSGFIKSYFDSLYNEEIITEESFNAWESSVEEEQGKGLAIADSSDFFRRLRRAAKDPEAESWNIHREVG